MWYKQQQNQHKNPALCSHWQGKGQLCKILAVTAPHQETPGESAAASLTLVRTTPTHQEGDSPLLPAGGCQRGAGKSECAKPHPPSWEGTPFASRVTKHPARSGSRGRSSGQPLPACLPPLTCNKGGWEQGAPPAPALPSVRRKRSQDQ